MAYRHPNDRLGSGNLEVINRTLQVIIVNFSGSMKMLLKIRRTMILLNTSHMVINKCLFSLSYKLDHSREFIAADDQID